MSAYPVIRGSERVFRTLADDLAAADIDIAEFPFRGRRGMGTCGLRIWHRDQHVVAMVTEIPTNPGESVSNAASSVWARIECEYRVASGGVRAYRIEHYPAEMPSIFEVGIPHRYGRIRFGSAGISWEPITAEQIASLILPQEAIR